MTKFKPGSLVLLLSYRQQRIHLYPYQNTASRAVEVTANMSNIALILEHTTSYNSGETRVLYNNKRYFVSRLYINLLQ